MPDLNDIFNKGKKPTDEELLKYLEGNASEAEQHAIEKSMNNQGFEEEAMEGLQQFSQKKKLDDYVKQINHNLHQHLVHKRAKKNKRQIKELPITITTVIIILAICVLAFLVLYLLQKG